MPQLGGAVALYLSLTQFLPHLGATRFKESWLAFGATLAMARAPDLMILSWRSHPADEREQSATYFSEFD